MENDKFVVIDVFDMLPSQLQEQMNELNSQGYKRVFQSDIQWYQGKGEWGIVVFELKED